MTFYIVIKKLPFYQKVPFLSWATPTTSWDWCLRVNGRGSQQHHGGVRRKRWISKNYIWSGNQNKKGNKIQKNKTNQERNSCEISFFLLALNIAFPHINQPKLQKLSLLLDLHPLKAAMGQPCQLQQDQAPSPLLFFLGEFSGETKNAIYDPLKKAFSVVDFPELSFQLQCLASRQGWLLLLSRRTTSLFCFREERQLFDDNIKCQ